ncbi:protein zwilch homolog [Hyperolius riggenbachi]|uniref:protein zwilch homolog n=1 Tax=Hyperolius riggenbachi TaxID=752182 RepID=UPI0035A30C74
MAAVVDERHREAQELHAFLSGVTKEKDQQGPFSYKDALQVRVVSPGQCKALEVFWNGSGQAFVMEGKPGEVEEEATEESNDHQSFSDSMKKSCLPVPVSTMTARRLLSAYTLTHNPNMADLRNGDPLEVLPQLWLRCDGRDPQETCWLGAEPITSRDGITAMTFHKVTCTGPSTDRNSYPSLEVLKKSHKACHHSAAMQTRGFAQYDLFSPIESSIMEAQTNVTVDFVWNGVDKILQIPPLTSTATLNIMVESGDLRSPVYPVYKELEFLLVLADGLRTGVTEWPETTEAKSAVELVQELLNELKNKLDGVHNAAPKKETEKVKSDTAAVDSSIHFFVSERGDLDFTEMLWCRMRNSVTCYKDVASCFSLVIQSLRHGDVHPWIHRGSSSTLSRLIQQSYHGDMPSVILSGLTPIRMLLEIGLDKMKRDYVNCFIGRELATFNYLDYFISSGVDVQEQVHRVRKLHHMMEVVAHCNAFLSLEHENLFPLTQICLKYYKEKAWNEQHVFQLPVRPTVISSFYHNSHPQTWRLEIVTGHGQKEVKTIWQLTSRPPVDHVSFNVPDVQINMTMSVENEDIPYYQSQASCSQVHFC